MSMNSFQIELRFHKKLRKLHKDFSKKYEQKEFEEKIENENLLSRRERIVSAHLKKIILNAVDDGYGGLVFENIRKDGELCRRYYEIAIDKASGEKIYINIHDFKVFAKKNGLKIEFIREMLADDIKKIVLYF